MKREAGDGPQGGGPQKRYRGGDGNEIRLLIPSKVAGSIIGKGGQNISKLRSEHNASVTVPDCPGPERIGLTYLTKYISVKSLKTVDLICENILTVAADLDTMLRVITEILPNLEDFQNNRGRRNQDNGDEVDIRMLVHQSQAGCIIGKGGLKIKELREKTGARIKIYSNCCPQSTDRIVQINGKGNLCVDAIRECMELLKTSPIKGVSNPYDPHNYDDFFSQEYGGYGGGGDDRRGGGNRGGPGNRGPPGRGGGPGNFGGPRGGFGGPRGGGPGNFGGRGPMGGPMGGPLGNGMGMNAPGPMGMGMGGPGPQGPGNFGGPPPMQNDKDSTQVTIPKELAGAIIGKGGSRIRKIRMDSGAGITIDEPLPGSNDRIITISGTSNQIQMAQYLLQQSVRENTSDY